MLSTLPRRTFTIRTSTGISRAGYSVIRCLSSRQNGATSVNNFRGEQSLLTDNYLFSRSLSSSTPYLKERKGQLRVELNDLFLFHSSHMRYRSNGYINYVREFHSSRPNKGVPIIPALIGVLKSSAALGILNTMFRVALTFIPAFLIKSSMIKKFLKRISQHAPHLEYKRPELLRRLRILRLLIRTLFLIPFALLAATLIASLERAPLTGRWRFILLSPAEEEEIVDTLKRTWRTAVNGVLAATLDSGLPPPAIPATDWRHQWVENTLRRLENAVPLLQSDPASKIHASFYNEEYPFPPPSAYPLVARPRTAQIMHTWMCPKMKARLEGHGEQDTEKRGIAIAHISDASETSLHLIGPPYSCLVVDDPSSQNAFSYGFGPEGAGGIVVYTGFLDEVLRNNTERQPQTGITSVPPSDSLFSRLFGPITVPRRNYYHQPTEEQTTELAVLLAHELAHLLLAHHLETLSSTSILIPSVISILTDVTRVIIFPFTMLFGPFVNDALAQLGTTHSGEMSKLSEMCAGRTLEIEADLVSARLLAYAGFDPRQAIKFWESRIEKSDPENPKTTVGCPIHGKEDESLGEWATSTASWAMGREVHPLNEERVQKLKEELERWKIEWRKLGMKKK